MTCDNCGATTTNGIALCQACRAWFLVNLEFIPVYYRNLSRWRPSSASGVRSVPSSREPRLPGVGGNDRIGRALEDALGDLHTWTDRIAQARPYLTRVITRIQGLEEEPAVHLTCALLTKHVDTLTTLPNIRDILEAISTLETSLRSETERAIPGWYAGACQHCTTPTHVVPGLTWVTCPSCGATTHASDHLAIILREASNWVAAPMRVAEALVALLDDEDSVPRLHKRISKWGERGQIKTHRRVDDDGDECGPKRYRLGDVLGALDGEAEKVG